MKEFHAGNFLRDLVDHCACTEAEGKQFAAAPSILGPLLCSAWRQLVLITLRYEALKNEFWQVRKSDDSKWRVYSAVEVMDGQEDGFDSAEEALDEAILRSSPATLTGLGEASPSPR